MLIELGMDWSGIGGMETFEISHSQLINRGPRK